MHRPRRKVLKTFLRYAYVSLTFLLWGIVAVARRSVRRRRMPPDVPLHFGPYTLAGPQGPLWREAQVVSLPPKALAVLWLLARQAGQVVPKAVLLDAVWTDTTVGEGVLTVCLNTLRQALGEDAK